VRPLAAVAIAVVIVAVFWVDHDRCDVMPMMVSHTDSNAVDADFDAFRNDHWFVADVQRTSNCRHRQD
jgi:hypothetical protein